MHVTQGERTGPSTFLYLPAIHSVQYSSKRLVSFKVKPGRHRHILSPCSEMACGGQAVQASVPFVVLKVPDRQGLQVAPHATISPCWPASQGMNGSRVYIMSCIWAWLLAVFHILNSAILPTNACDDVYFLSPSIYRLKLVPSKVIATWCHLLSRIWSHQFPS